MTLQEAEKLLKINVNTHKIDKISETANYFIFGIVPIDFKSQLDRSFTPPIAVEKRTGRTLSFNPARFPREELKSLKRIR